MASNGQGSGSARAVHYLHHPGAAPEHRAQKPQISAPTDIGYSMHRFLHPEHHVDDRYLRSPPGSTPLTEDQSRARIAGILDSLALDSVLRPA
ncbi:hypothetical protein GGS23DRAFT_497004 [Durotheca rogersii]|uniref:uncharacterized protein n=1 Tax=Durotheca rogersii TaxID=419775 RepID=UPI00221E76BF|nr:uncharacterized protein GGS23DRAFT_497004 [Durotheca rogersii]KAI5864383.1 hypothetical protein GGS23DRAFT_497004 [Durotheca rogersii]